MEIEALERPAALRIWHAGAARYVPTQPRQFPSLREAIAAAACTLPDPDRHPWIVTAEGELLPPTWIRGRLRERAPRPDLRAAARRPSSDRPSRSSPAVIARHHA
jgi:hypothetical protein